MAVSSVVSPECPCLKQQQLSGKGTYYWYIYLLNFEHLVIPGLGKSNPDLTQRMATKEGDIEASAANSTLASAGAMSS